MCNIRTQVMLIEINYQVVAVAATRKHDDKKQLKNFDQFITMGKSLFRVNYRSKNYYYHIKIKQFKVTINNCTLGK